MPVVGEWTDRVYLSADAVFGGDDLEVGYGGGFHDLAAGGAYTWIGAGDVGPRQGLHGDRYVFNDDIVPIVLAYWVNLVEQELPAPSAKAAA